MSDLYSTIADRLPSFGLLILRIVAAAVLILRFFQLHRWDPIHVSVPYGIAAVAGLLLLVGSWTVAAGILVGAIQFLLGLFQNGDPIISVLLATVAFSLALLGAGAWSIDAWRFGWKRIEIRRPN